MADGFFRPASILVGIAGLCVSGAVGVGLGQYTTTGINPLYAETAPSRLDRVAAAVSAPAVSPGEDQPGMTPASYGPSTLTLDRHDNTTS